MYLKAVAMIVFVTALGAGMLSLRQQRWEVKHDVTHMHKQIEQCRRSTWESQVRVAGELRPEKLEHRIAVAQIDMEPITATNDANLQRMRVVGDRIALKTDKNRAAVRNAPPSSRSTPAKNPPAKNTPRRTPR